MSRERRRAVSAEDDEGKRRRARRQRAREERAAFDPRPPGDDDFTVADDDRLRIVRRPEEVGGLLDGYVRRRGWADRLRGAAVHDRWEEIVGPELAAKCRPVRLAAGQLVIRAETSVWATQIGYLTTTIQARAIAVLGEGTVREVRVTVGPLDDLGS